MEETRTIPQIAERASALPIEGQVQRETRCTVRFDLEAYMPLLEDTDIPDDQKMELLRALYAIMASFVDLGFTVDTNACGQPHKFRDPSAQALRDHVCLSHQNKFEYFNNAAARPCDTAGEGVEA